MFEKHFKMFEKHFMMFEKHFKMFEKHFKMFGTKFHVLRAPIDINLKMFEKMAFLRQRSSDSRKLCRNARDPFELLGLEC